MNGEKLELEKSEIQQLGLNAIKEYFRVDIDKLDKSILTHLHNRAKIGMQFEREVSISRRAVEMNYLRVFKMIAEDKKEIKALIKKSLPKYLK